MNIPRGVKLNALRIGIKIIGQPTVSDINELVVIMPRYKVLKNIAHNIAHSYFSLMNYIDGEYAFEYIFNIVRAKNQPRIFINIIDQTIEPEEFNTPAIKLSLQYLKKNLVRLLNTEGMTLDDIRSAWIEFFYDFEKTVEETHPFYDLCSSIVDKNGKEHKAKVVEWWKY